MNRMRMLYSNYRTVPAEDIENTPDEFDELRSDLWFDWDTRDWYVTVPKRSLQDNEWSDDLRIIQHIKIGSENVQQNPENVQQNPENVQQNPENVQQKDFIVTKSGKKIYRTVEAPKTKVFEYNWNTAPYVPDSMVLEMTYPQLEAIEERRLWVDLENEKFFIIPKVEERVEEIKEKRPRRKCKYVEKMRDSSLEIEEFPGYYIDKLGNVYKKGKRIRELIQTKHKRGWMVSLVKEGKRVWRLVHTLMVNVFLGQWDTKVKHNDGDIYNNELENLVDLTLEGIKRAYIAQEGTFMEALTSTSKVKKGAKFSYDIVDWVQQLMCRYYDWTLLAIAQYNRYYPGKGWEHLDRMWENYDEMFQRKAKAYANLINRYLGSTLDWYDVGGYPGLNSKMIPWETRMDKL